jgi:hypothetical protein
LTVKPSLIFEKRFMVLKTINRFPKLNSSSLHACLIFDCQNPAMVGRRNPGDTEIRQHPVTEILLAPESSNIRPLSTVDQIPTEIGQKPAGSGQNGGNPAGSDQIQPLI